MTDNPTQLENKPIYVASRASIPERGQMWRSFRDQGVRITSSWIDEDGDGQTGDFGELWERIANEIRAAGTLILYAEAGDFPLKGAFIEAGIALGMGKPVIVCLPDLGVLPRNYRPIGSWIAHPLVTRCDDINTAVRAAQRPALAMAYRPPSPSSPVPAEQFKPMCNDPDCWVCNRMAELHLASSQYGWTKRPASTPERPRQIFDAGFAATPAPVEQERRQSAIALLRSLRDTNDPVEVRRQIESWNQLQEDLRATPSPSLAAREAAERAAREVIDAVWGEAKKLAESFVKANIRNYNDHKGVESLERVYDAKRDTAQQIFNQMHNFNEARWKRPDDIVEIILKHCSPVPAAGEEREFLDASVAVWREIDRLSALPQGYKGLPPETDPRKRELAAWQRYRAALDAADSVGEEEK